MAEMMTWAKIFAVTDLDPALICKDQHDPVQGRAGSGRPCLEKDPEAKVMVIMDGSVLSRGWC